MEKFQLHYLPGGYVRITWKGIEVAVGRPWITNKDTEGYSELVQYLWHNEEYCDRIQPVIDDRLIG